MGTGCKSRLEVDERRFFFLYLGNVKGKRTFGLYGKVSETAGKVVNELMGFLGNESSISSGRENRTRDEPLRQLITVVQ